MTPLPPYVPGTQDTRNFTVEGHGFHVYRGDHGGGEVAFWGGGRDGDYVTADDPRIDILARAIAGIDGLSPAWIGHRSDSATVIDAVERRMLELAGRYGTIYRQVWGNVEAARRAVAVPRAPLVKRNLYISGGSFSLSLDVPEHADAVVSSWAWGNPTGTFVEETLTELGAPLDRVAGSDVNKHYVVPAGCLAAFLDKAILVNNASDVRVVDDP
ncbi:MAG: hypothetical protein JNL83_25525 [Myxococcales bacterium]|nr:hypothetical protein [Myxococcales bacterium]